MEDFSHLQVVVCVNEFSLYPVIFRTKVAETNF